MEKLFVTLFDNHSRVLGRRARLSHTFLDHEVLLIDDIEAIARQHNGDWPDELLRLHKRLDDCQALTCELMMFSGSTLIDLLPPLQLLSEEERAALKIAVDAHVKMWLVESDAEAKATSAVRKLLHAVDRFKETVNRCDKLDESVTSDWGVVRQAAAMLKTLFIDGTIPRGIVLS